jgi:hypothetical protein
MPEASINEDRDPLSRKHHVGLSPYRFNRPDVLPESKTPPMKLGAQGNLGARIGSFVSLHHPTHCR